MFTVKSYNKDIIGEPGSKKLKILHLESMPGGALAISEALKTAGMKYEFLIVNTRLQVEEALSAFCPDLILADYFTESIHSSQALEKMLQAGPLIPIILIASPVSEAFAINLLQKGADDYVMADGLKHLPVIIQNCLRKQQSEKELRINLNELLKREKRYSTLIENISDGVMILSADGKPTYVSASVEKLLGYTEEEVLKLDLLTIAHPEDIQALMDVMEQVFKNPGVPVKGHTGRIRHKNGTWRWLEATVTNMLHDPAINGIIDNFRDVTEIKHAEEEAAKKEYKYKALIENNADGMAIISANGKPLYASPSTEDILGYDHEQALGLNLFEIIHPEDTSLMVDTMQQAMANPGVPVKGEATRVRHKNGEWRWIDGVITNMLHNPSVCGIIDNFRDVTEKKLVEKKIINTNRLLAFISQINQVIIHARCEQTLFSDACRIALEVGKFKAAWIGLFDFQHQQIRITEELGLMNDDLISFAKASYENDGPQSHVLSTGTCYLSNNIQQDAASPQWKAATANRLFNSCMALPIRQAGGIIGTFNLYSSDFDFFRKEEVLVLEQAAEEISFALDVFEKERLRLLADEKVAESELSLKQAQAVAHVGSWDMNYATGIAVWSDEQLKIFGFPPGEKEQTFENWSSSIHPDDLDYVLKVTNEAKSNAQNCDYFHRIKRKDGTVRHLYVQTRVKFNHEGIPAGLHGVAHDVTEMKEAEMALRASESDMHAVFENTSDGFILADTEGIIKSFNVKSRDWIYLNTGQEIKIGNSILDYVHESRRSAYKDGISKVLSGEILKYDNSFTRKNGETKWFHFTIHPVYIRGHIRGVSITAADITQRKEAEQKLQESELFNKGVLASLGSHIAVIDDTGEIIAVNKAWDDFAKTNGAIMLEKTSVGSNYFDVCKKAIAAGEHVASDVMDGILSVFRQQQTFFELEYPCHSPVERKWFIIHVENFGNDASKVVISHQNISQQKKTEAALRESEANLQAIFDNTAEGFILVDLKGQIKSFNNKAQEIFLLNSGKIIDEGKIIFDYVPESKREFYKSIIPTVASGKDVQYDIPFERNNGEVNWFIFTINRVTKSGITVGFSITAQDITERKQMEELIIRSKSNLDAIIENTDAFIYSLDTNFRYITYNTSLEKMMKKLYGITISPGYHVFDFISEFDPGAVQEWNNVYTRGLKGEVVNFDKEFVVDDYYSYTSFSIHPIWEHNKVIGLSCFVNDRTKEKLTEKAVRQSELRYRQIVETAQEGIWLVGEDNKTIFVNNKLCEILGYKEDEFLGKDIYGFMDDEGKQLAVQAMENKKNGISGNAEFKYISKSGDEVWTYISANPIFDDAGKYKGALAMISDITEKRKLKNLLDVTNNMARIGSYEANLKNNTLYWSPLTKAIHEVADDYIPDINSSIAFYKEGPSREALIKAFNEAVSENIPFDLELQIVTAKGTDKWIRTIGQAECHNGVCERVYGSFQDIDKLKSAELELLKAYEEKNIILESIGDAFFATDKSWVVTYWNKEAERLLHHTKQNMLGRGLWDVFADSVDSQFYKQYHLAIETGVAVSFQEYYSQLNKWFEVSAFPSAGGLSVYFKDITSRKQAETERTKILTDITQRNKDLEQFSYIVSHNLRAPVANIIGLAEELNFTGHSSEIKAMFNKELLANVKRLDDVIIDLNGILQTKREISEKKETVVFSELVENIKSSIRSLIEKEHAIITTDFTQASQFITIKSYFYSIFYNLISNSIKYRRPDIHPLIEITASKNEHELLIIFQDNGTGIDLLKKGDHVFGLYKRFHKDIEGKGMGLFMVKTQVETLGGKISIQSAINKGTQFRITFEL